MEIQIAKTGYYLLGDTCFRETYIKDSTKKDMLSGQYNLERESSERERYSG